MNKLFSDNLDAITRLCIENHVKELFVFGSSITGNFISDSDIDFLISFGEISIDQYTESYFAMHTSLEELFHREIELVTERSLSNPFFIQSVEQTKQLLYAA